jgi:Uma2 family endonuclease
MVALRKLPPAHMSVADFLAWAAGDRSVRKWQLIDGEPVAMAPAGENHGAIQAEAGRLLANHLLAIGSRCRVITEAGIVPRLRSDRNYRVPDLGVTCAPPANAMMVAEPVLLVEILSPSNEVETRANLWAYATIPSVTEILVLSSTRMEAELLRRDTHGLWPDAPVMTAPGGVVTLDSVGFSAPLDAFYRTTSLIPS